MYAHLHKGLDEADHDQSFDEQEVLKDFGAFVKEEEDREEVRWISAENISCKCQRIASSVCVVLSSHFKYLFFLLFCKVISGAQSGFNVGEAENVRI